MLSLVKGTRSAQLIVGLLVIVVVGFIARYFDLLAVRWIMDSLKTVWLIVILRVHDVAQTVRVARVADAARAAKG